MAGCMVFVFAALGEFVVVKVLDVQYQYQATRVPKVIPMVSIKLETTKIRREIILKTTKLTPHYYQQLIYFI